MEKKPVSPFRLMMGGKTWREWRKEFKVKRKPVYCAHPALEAEMDNRNLCLTCHSVWINGAQPPQVAIAYFEAGEDGGK